MTFISNLTLLTCFRADIGDLPVVVTALIKHQTSEQDLSRCEDTAETRSTGELPHTWPSRSYLEDWSQDILNLDTPREMFSSHHSYFQVQTDKIHLVRLNKTIQTGRSALLLV